MKTISIVSHTADPVWIGLVESLARSVRFEPVVNLKTANALNIAIPPGVLVRAGEIVE